MTPYGWASPRPATWTSTARRSTASCSRPTRPPPPPPPTPWPPSPDGPPRPPRSSRGSRLRSRRTPRARRTDPDARARRGLHVQAGEAVAGGHRDGDEAPERHPPQPPRPGVAPRPEGVQERQRPGRVGQPVQPPPHAVRHPRAQQAGDHEDRDQVQRERPEPPPHRVAGAQERHEDVDRPQLGDGVRPQRHQVHTQQDRRRQRGTPVDLGEGEPRHLLREYRPAVSTPSPIDSVSSSSAATPCPAQEPERLVHAGTAPAAATAPRPAAGTTARTSAAAGHAPRWIGVPSTPSSRAASPCPVSRAGAPGPRTTAAVDHVLASTQVPAATVTLPHTGSTGRQVAGSRMWCSSRPSRRHCRDRVLDVARAAPGGRLTRAAGSPGWSRTRTRQPPAGPRPAVAMSPPSETSTPIPSSPDTTRAHRSAAQAFAVAPRSSVMSAGTVTTRCSGSTSMRCHPGAGRRTTRMPSVRRTTSGKSRS